MLTMGIWKNGRRKAEGRKRRNEVKPIASRSNPLPAIFGGRTMNIHLVRRLANLRLLPTAFCLLPSAYCLLLSACSFSTHTAPSSKYSFFQIGTIFFKRSIA